MADIIDLEDLDHDLVEPEVLAEKFTKGYKLSVELAVSLKKSYVKKLCCTKSLKIGVSLSNKRIEIYELKGSSLSHVCRLSGHSKPVTDIVFSPKEDHLIYSSGQDGVIKLWDTRCSGTCAQEYKEQNVKPYDCMDITCNGQVLCAGTQLVKNDAFLVLWDHRNTKPLGGYWNSHTDNITQVQFHKSRPELLVTGSEDGLINVFNIMEQTEDEALTYSLNVENSVEKLTWLDDNLVSCITQSNDLQLWNADSGDLIKCYARDKVAKSIKRSKGDDCYLVDCYMSADETATLLAGSYGGNGDCLRSVTLAEKKLEPATNFAENKQIVTCCSYDKDRDLLITSGESGHITVWSGSERASGASDAKMAARVEKLHVQRHKPY